MTSALNNSSNDFINALNNHGLAGQSALKMVPQKEVVGFKRETDGQFQVDFSKAFTGKFMEASVSFKKVLKGKLAKDGDKHIVHITSGLKLKWGFIKFKPLKLESSDSSIEITTSVVLGSIVYKLTPKELDAYLAKLKINA